MLFIAILPSTAAVLGDSRYSKECENGAASSKAKLENRLDYTWISS